MVKLFLGILLLLVSGCTLEVAPDNNPQPGDNDMQRSGMGRILTASFTTTMNTQSGSGEINGLQQSNLEPGEYTIQFGVIPPPNIPGAPPTQQAFSANAIVSWKSDGQQQRRVISLIPGAAITGVCDAVDVRIQDLGTLFGPNNPGSEYKVIQTMSKGSRANIQQPVVLVTDVAQTIAAPGSLNFFVPRDSGVVAYQALVAQSSPLPLTSVFDVIASQNALGNVIATDYPMINTGWIPLAPGVIAVELVNQNTTGPSPILANIIWGIEG